MARPGVSIGQVMGLIKSFFGENAYSKSEVFTKTEVNEAIENSQHLKREIVVSLPTGSAIDINTIYMIQNGNSYDEYLWVVDKNDWELIGSSSADLTDYYTKSQVDTLISQVDIDVDSSLSASSENPVQNKVLTGALNTKQNILTFDQTPTENSSNPVTSGGVFEALNNMNIDVDSELSNTSENPLQNKIVKAELDKKRDDFDISDGTTTLTQRDVIEIASPLTVEDDDTEGDEKTVIGADTSGALDFTQIVAPGVTHDPVYGNPVGTVISFFGYEAPLGYLICDGTEYAKADYPYLATHLADLDDHYSTTQYEGSDSDHFKVPDLRGEFLRGTGTNSHTNQGNGSNVGVHQDGTNIFYQKGSSTSYMPGVFFTTGTEFSKFTNSVDNLRDSTNHAKGITNATGKVEYSVDVPVNAGTSRPTNTSVLYCIKYN